MTLRAPQRTPRGTGVPRAVAGGAAAVGLVMVVVIAVLGALSGEPSTACAGASASLPAPGTSGRSLTGRVSWFGGPHDPTTWPMTASGQPTSTPGIAVYDTATLGGYWQIQLPNHHLAVLPQTDIGPAPWTGRMLDVTYSALPDLGYDTQSFPTDATISAVYLGKSVGASATCTTTSGDRSAASVAAAADALDQLHVPYNYGGGHVTPARPTAGLEGSYAGLDCSSAVSYVLQHAGIDTPTLDSTGFMSWGEPGPGRQVTIYANTGHVLMRIDERYFGTSGFGHSARGAGPAWFTVDPPADYLATFMVRHPPGL